MLLFSFIRFSFENEFLSLRKTKFFKEISELVEATFGSKLKFYLLYFLAGVVIASPLPDEFGVIMIAGLTKIKPGTLAFVGFVLNS
ncbi:hypothetical protein COV15_01145 [Candidatus Woesearchaeota archaeon CG10_big_fil_rev_8_21_14_0_10_34_12]|nr:MAG: hypothetical protein COV15_01145 [Candidatus Woesearchaeota archaeon CG10_big_fil_rev_8_21_14_0_10_34_12]